MRASRRTDAARWALRPLLLLVVALVLLHWRIGPVVLTVTATHGVHLGDALAALPALGAVAPHRRLRLDRRVGIARPLSSNPMRRASDRTQGRPSHQSRTSPTPFEAPGFRSGA